MRSARSYFKPTKCRSVRCPQRILRHRADSLCAEDSARYSYPVAVAFISNEGVRNTSRVVLENLAYAK